MLNFSVAKIKELLHEQFIQVDAALKNALDVIEEKNFPGGREAKRSLIIHQHNLTQDLDIIQRKYHEDLSKVQPHPALSGMLAQSFIDTQKSKILSNYHSDYLVAHIKKYKALNDEFISFIYERYLVLLNESIKMPPIHMAMIEWIKFGLENLSSLSYSIINNISAWLEQNSNHQEKSYWESIKQSITSTIISKTSIYEQCTKSIFDIPGYTDNLQRYTEHAKETGSLQLGIQQNLAIQANQHLPDTILNIEKLSGSLSHLLSSGSISIDKILSHIPKKSDLPHEANSLEVAKLTQASAEEIFIQILFYEIKELKELAAKMNLKGNKDSNLQECINMVAHVLEHKHDALDSKPALDFSINLSESWLEDICRKKSDPKEAALQVLAVRFKKLIETFKLLNFEIPKIGDIEGLDVYLRSIGIVHTSKSLTQIVNLKNQIINSYVENTLLEPTPLPNFDRLTLDANKKVSGGSQEKSIGTGFYTNNITSELFFVKRTTRLHLLADDISETLSSEICNILKFTQFAQCLPIYSKTTRDIYIASKCEEGFNPIFNMDGRLTSRLLPGERKEFIQKLDQGSKDQLLNILFMSNLIGDYDPNPGNIGTTTNRGIIKIDHGWAFDQVLSDFMPTWHNTLNPLRYPARFAPTNALCDYNFLLHNAKTDFFQHLFVRFQKPDSLQESLLAIFHNIAKIYEGTRASGSLKDKIEKQDIIALLCERFGLPHTDEVTFELLSEKLNAALYTRFHNLYLITLLDKIKHTKHIANTVSEHNELKKQLGFMLECNVPYNNLGLIKKLSTEIKETHNNRELHKTIECILNRTQLMNNASSSSLPQMTRSKPAPSIIQKFNMLENKDEAKEETVFRVPDMPPRNRTQLMNNASSSSLPQMVRSKPALSIIPKFNTLESKGEAKEETVFRVPDIPSRNKKRGVRTNTSPPRKKQRK